MFKVRYFSTYIYINAILIENLSWRMISRYVAIKLVSVLVPFDRVKRLTVHIKVTL
jgi:hypothetical protein